jgi:hypothetical protein
MLGTLELDRAKYFDNKENGAILLCALLKLIYIIFFWRMS